MKIQDLSLKVKLGALFTISLLLNFIGFFVIIQFINDYENDAKLVNVTGSQRILTQQIVNESHQIANGMTSYKDKLQLTIEKFKKNHQNILFGNKKLGIPITENPAIIKQLIEITKTWKTLSEKLNKLLNEKYSPTLPYILKEIEAESIVLLEQVDQVSLLIEKSAKEKVDMIKRVQISIMLVNFSMFLFGIWASINHIINPITEIIKLMNRVAQGDINIRKITVFRKDEVGQLSKSFNSMVSNLKHLVLTGKIQKDFLPKEISNQTFELKTIYKPSEYVSGDFLNYVWNKEHNRLYGYLIDVMGHGLGTALQTSQLNVLFELAMNNGERSLVEKVAWVNNQSIKYFSNETFAAGLCFEFDFNSKTLKYVPCGINQFYVKTRHQNGFIKTEGALIGIMEDMPYTVHELSFELQDQFYFLTDGITDILNINDLQSISTFLETFKMLETLSESEWVKDDASAICLHMK